MKKTTIDDFVNRLTSHMESNINQTVSHGHDTHIKVLPLSKETIIQVLEAIAQGGRDTSTLLSSHVSDSKADKVSQTRSQDHNIAHDQHTESLNLNRDKIPVDNANAHVPSSKINPAETLATGGRADINIVQNEKQKDPPVTDLSVSVSDSLSKVSGLTGNKVGKFISSDTAVAKNLKSESETSMFMNEKKRPKLLDLTTVTIGNRPDRQPVIKSIETADSLDKLPRRTTKSGTPTSMDLDRQPPPSSQQDNLKSSGTSKLQASSDSQSPSHNKLKERIASLWRKPDTKLSSRHAPRPLSRHESNRKVPGSSNRFGRRTEEKPVSSPKGSVPRLKHRPRTSNRERSMPEYFPPSWREPTADRQANERTGSQMNRRQRTFQDGRQRQTLGNNGFQWHNRPPLALRGFRGQPFSPRQAFMSSRLPTDEIRRIPQRQSRTRARVTSRPTGRSRQLGTNPSLSETQINNRGLVQRSRSSHRQRSQSRFRPASSRSSRRFGSSSRGETRASSRRRFGSSFLESKPQRPRGLDTIQRIRPNNNNRRVMFVGSPEGAQRVISDTDLGRGKDAL
ncbi:MAG: hypothetical protein AB2693_25575, partial [Candidatus Thiodiazotropha sp.]